jgi:hypothetical protein
MSSSPSIISGSPMAHEARLADLLEHVAEELDRYRAGGVDAFAVDETIHQYRRAAQVWKFCSSGGVGANTGIVAEPRPGSANSFVEWDAPCASAKAECELRPGRRPRPDVRPRTPGWRRSSPSHRSTAAHDG